VTPENIGEWLRAGAAAVGIGTALVGPGREPVNAATLKARVAILSESLAAS